jgi:hypothetical protein
MRAPYHVDSDVGRDAHEVEAQSTVCPVPTKPSDLSL